MEEEEEEKNWNNYLTNKICDEKTQTVTKF